MEPHTTRTIFAIESLLSEVEKIRKTDYAIDDEERADGVFGVGATFRDDTWTCA